MNKELIEGLRLSPQQKRLWTLQQLDEALPYRAQCAVRIEGSLDVASFVTAVEQMVQRQEILRTTFRCLPGMTIPLQVINEGSHALVDAHDWNGWGKDEQEAQLEGLFDEMKQTPFDLEYGPVLQASLITLAADRSVLLLCLPSMNADAQGLKNLVKELSLHYGAVLHDESLAGQPMQYADSSEWHNELLSAPGREEGREYWREQDFSAIQQLELPCEARPAENTKFKPQFLAAQIKANRLAELERRAEKHELAPALMLLACWQVLLWRLTAREQIIVGSATDGREPEELKAALGLYATYLPAQCRLDESLQFTGLLEHLRRSTRESEEYQEYFNLEQLETAGETRLGQPFFPFCFDYVEKAASCVAGGVTFTIEKEYACAERFHVRLSCVRTADGLTAEFHYDAGLYEAADIARLAAQFETLLGSVLKSDEVVRIAELEMVGETERRQLLVEWNDTAREYPREQRIHELIEAQAALRPEAVAAVCEGQELTYGELNARANQVARHLRNKGVGAEVPVGLCVERSLEMIVGVLGILKAGGAYVALDPSYPRERLGFMVADSGARVLLTQQHLMEVLPVHEAAVVCLDSEWEEIGQGSRENPGWRAEAGNLAYVIYTSGSSGRPKGVGVTQQNLVHTTAARFAYYRTPPRRFLLLSSFAFDSSVAGIFWTLCGGGALVLPAEGLQRDAQALVGVAREQAVTHLLSLPSLHALMLDVAQPGELAELRVVIVAGEVCPGELVARHLEKLSGARLYNEYGPTEASVWSTVYECGEVVAGRSVSIGKVISNAQAYILDEGLRPAAVGVAGELYLGGQGITRGYLHQAAATAEKFIPNPFGAEPGSRLYRTGDVGRHLGDGKIEFIGRIDTQVKLRGYRIELGEIETLLGAHPEVQAAVVVARASGVSGANAASGDGEKQLVAYVERGAEGKATDGELREYLRERLPAYMVPTWVVVLNELPLMANGKIDRQALPAPGRVVTQGDFSAPRTPVEEVLVGIWAAVLGIAVLGMAEPSVTANFFELGGHSLLATQVMSRVREAFGIELPVRSLFSAPTVRELAETVAQALLAGQSLIAPPINRTKRDHALPLSFAQQRLWFADQLTPGNTFFNVVSAVRLIGPLVRRAIERTLAEIIRRHEVLRTTFPSKKGKPVQMIAPSVDFKLMFTDLSGLERDKREAETERLTLEATHEPFDLAKGPLVRASLLRLGEEEHALLLTMHHIVSDAWSKGVLIKEFTVLYEAYSVDGMPALAELPIQYADYALWQRDWLSGEVLDLQLAYWKKQLQGAPATLELPLDRERPVVQSFQGASLPLALTQQMSVALKELGRREGVTLFMTLLTAFKMLLHYYSKQDDIVVGANVANRNRSETEGLIGFFVNTVVLRSDLSGDPRFVELLKQVREVCLEAYAHQDLPFEKVVALLHPERDLSRHPLFQVKFELDNDLISGLKLSGLTLSPMELPSDIGIYDLHLSITETHEGLVGNLVYDKSLFDEATISRMTSQFEILLQKIAERPGMRLSELDEELAQSDKQYKIAREADYKNSIRQKFKRVRKPPLTATS